MKGFIYLIEIAVAGILVLVIMGSLFSSQLIKTSWERIELIEIGDGITNSLKNTYNIGRVFNDSTVFTEMRSLKPTYIDYTFRVSGIPKNNILVGTNNIDIANYISGKAVVNNRVISFTAENLDYSNLNKYDIIVVDSYDSRMASFSKGVVGVGNVDGSVFKNFIKIGKKDDNMNLIGSYSPLLKKYFRGIGFYAKDSASTGSFSLNSGSVKFRIYNDKIELLTEDNEPTGLFYYVEGESVPIGTSLFKVKKIDTDVINDFPDGVYIRPGYGFTDDYFAGPNKPTDQEYGALMKSAVAAASIDSRGWFMDEYKEPNVYVPTFITLGNDIPETAELDVILWYTY